MLAQTGQILLGHWCTLPKTPATAKDTEVLSGQCIFCMTPERCQTCHKQLCHPVNGDCRPSNKAMRGHYYAKSDDGLICMECHDKGCE